MAEVGEAPKHPWRDEKLMRTLYEDEGLSQSAIAERFGCTQPTVSVWLKNLGIEARDFKTRTNTYATFIHCDANGYERWKDSDHTACYAHRLLAAVDHDDVGVVHHVNGIKWDNRPENIEVFESQSEHRKWHIDNDRQH